MLRDHSLILCIIVKDSEASYNYNIISFLGLVRTQSEASSFIFLLSTLISLWDAPTVRPGRDTSCFANLDFTHK